MNEDLVDRGRNVRLPDAPPSEPCMRVYRTRLSSWWFTSGRIDWLPHGLQQERTTPVQQRRHFASVDGRCLFPTPAATTFPKYAAQAHAYPGVQRSKGGVMAVFEGRNQPLRVRLTSEIIARRLWPLIRWVLSRIASLSFFSLFRLGQRMPRSK